jgi:CubicO group peptidase (beta-lactamase class C family)
MYINSKTLIFLTLAFCLISHAIEADSSQNIPGKVWYRYQSPEEAGFAKPAIEELRSDYDSLNASALMVIYRGAVVINWGETARRFRCHSARKSLMSGLYGIHIDNGDIDTTKTLEQLGINDTNFVLNKQELQATILDILCARSGVYHLAAYEPAENPKPPRGSFAPGTNWCYNNWDFNVLLTILEQETGVRVFEDFEKHFAQPLQMQDYHPSHGYYHYELDKSIHPAYPFRLSARDMARFGLLYLNNGRWGDRQILSESYVRASTSRISDSTMTGGYGYMWWLYDAEPLKSLGAYSALGLGIQSIDVIPGANMVVVLRTDTFEGDNVGMQEHGALLSKILATQSEPPADNPSLVPLNEPDPAFTSISPTRGELENYVGERPLGNTPYTCVIDRTGDTLAIDFGEGPVNLYKLEENHYIIEDFQEHLYFKTDSAGVIRIIAVQGLIAEAMPLLDQGLFEEGLEIMRVADSLFPNNKTVFQVMADIYADKISLDLSMALDYLRQLQAVDPSRQLSNSRLAWIVNSIQGQIWQVHLPLQRMQQFAGKYGPRLIELDNGRLYYSREGREGRRLMTPITDSIFGIEGLNDFRVQFVSDSNGDIVKLVGMYLDGRRDVTPRSQ